MRFAPLVLLFAAAHAHAQAPPDTLRPPADAPALLSFGWTVDADDTWLLVGAREAPTTATKRDARLSDLSGTAFMYRLEASGPVLAARFRPDDTGPSNCFSLSLDVREDWAVVAAECEGAPGVGAVYLYHYDGTEWTRADKFLPQDIVGPYSADAFGTSVALGDGYLVIGSAGAAFVFEQTGGAWVQTATLAAADATPTNAGTGGPVAVIDTQAGAHILIGRGGVDGPNGEYSQGAVISFARENGAWVQGPVLRCPGSGADSACGYIVKAGNGSAAVVSQTAVYPIDYAGGGWAIGAALTPADFDTYGVARWGSRLLAVGPRVGPPFTGRHPAYVFTEQAQTWRTDFLTVPAFLTQFFNGPASIVTLNSTTAFFGRAYSDRYVLVQRLDGTTAAEPAPTTALALTLAPNPTAGTARARFSTATAGPARLVVTDALGRRVAEQDLGALGAGPHDVALGLGRLAPGVYVVRLVTADGTATRRLVRQ